MVSICSGNHRLSVSTRSASPTNVERASLSCLATSEASFPISGTLPTDAQTEPRELPSQLVEHPLHLPNRRLDPASMLVELDAKGVELPDELLGVHPGLRYAVSRPAA